MKKILKSMLIISSVAVIAFASTQAYFSDTEVSRGNVLKAGAIDLKIDNESYYNGEYSPETSWELKDLEEGDLFFNFLDLKPGDEGEDTVSIHVTSNPAWVCVDIDLTSDDENIANEPELDMGDLEDNLGDLFDGELAQNLNFVFWADDGDNVLEEGEQILIQGPASSVLDGVSWAIADSTINIFGGDGPLSPDNTYYIGKAWCFGELTLEPLLQGEGQSPTVASGVQCNGAAVSNMSQTDKLTGDITFRAVQERHNREFVCSQECEVGPGWASSLHDVAQGKRKDGSDVSPERSDPNNVMGEDDEVFFSLGFGGSIVVDFDGLVVDVGGVDLSFHETTNGTYPLEQADVYVSQDGVNYTQIGTVDNTSGGEQYLDFSSSGYSWIMYVKIVDTTDPSPFGGTADGYDLDAVDAVEIDNCPDF